MKYSLETWADGFGDWYCKVTFDFPGVGNSPEGEELKYSAVRAAKRRIREELKLRQAQPLARLRYEVHANQLDSMNRMHSITIKEVG
jgi:hypothetical protein